MTGKRAYTILVLGSGAQILKRFKISHRAFVGVVAAVVSAGTAAALGGLVLPPVCRSWFDLQSKVRHLEMQNRLLAEERERVEDLVTDVGDRLDRFESLALRIAALSEASGTVEAASRRSSGPAATRPAGGPPQAGRSPAVGAGEDLGATAHLLVERADLLERQLDAVEEELLRRAEQVSRLPLLWPADGPVGNGYGWRDDPFTGERELHRGLDILAAWGSPVVAPATGMVSQAGYAAGYGRCVTLSHTADIETRFGHLSRITVRAGQTVLKGQVIGYVGSTGRSSGPHLHYEVLVRSRQVDPIRFLRSKTAGLMAARRF